MALEEIKGIGPSSARKLRVSGVERIEDLAELDLRNGGVEGLSKHHLARLRANARTFLEAQEAPDITLVDGVGPSVAAKLAAAGVESIEDLVELDLRRQEVDGLSTPHLQRLKQAAMHLLPEL